MECKCRAYARCLPCIERDGLTRSGVQVFADDPDSPETWGQEADGLTDAEREIERRALLRLQIDDAAAA